MDSLLDLPVMIALCPHVCVTVAARFSHPSAWATPEAWARNEVSVLCGACGRWVGGHG